MYKPMATNQPTPARRASDTRETIPAPPSPAAQEIARLEPFKDAFAAFAWARLEGRHL